MMNSIYGDISDKIEMLYKMITKHDFPRNHDEWGGADVIITSNQRDTRPVPRMVITRHAGQVSWLIVQLKSAFDPLLDHCNKFEFYGRLANRALYFMKTNRGDPICETDLCDMLLSILREASVMLDEFKSGDFQCLLVTWNGQIHDEISEKTDSVDWSTEATQRYFEKLTR
jgi:hypothetical protein